MNFSWCYWQRIKTENFVINTETSKNFSARASSSLCGFLGRCRGSRKGEIHNFSLSSFCFQLFSRLASANSRFYGSVPDTLGGIRILPTWTVFTLCPPSTGSGCACWVPVVFPVPIAGTQKMFVQWICYRYMGEADSIPQLCAPVVTDMWDDGITVRTRTG